VSRARHGPRPPDDPAQEPIALEFAESLPDGHPADAERLGEVTLGRELRAGHELTRRDRARELLGNCHV